MGVSKLFQFFLLQSDMTSKQEGDVPADSLVMPNIPSEAAADSNNSVRKYSTWRKHHTYVLK